MMKLRAYAGRPSPQGSDRRDESTAEERYRLISIDAVHAPEGCTGNDWHTYRIGQGENEITGYRQGDLARVTADVEAIVTALNERRDWAKTKAAKSQRRTASAPRTEVK